MAVSPQLLVSTGETGKLRVLFVLCLARNQLDTRQIWLAPLNSPLAGKLSLKGFRVVGFRVVGFQLFGIRCLRILELHVLLADQRMKKERNEREIYQKIREVSK